VPTNPPQPSPPQEEAANTPEDRSGPAPPPVEPADTPVILNRMETPQVHEKEAARKKSLVQVDPLYWRHHP